MRSSRWHSMEDAALNKPATSAVRRLTALVDRHG
jgi:hypothetical protein